MFLFVALLCFVLAVITVLVEEPLLFATNQWLFAFIGFAILAKSDIALPFWNRNAANAG